EMRPIVATMNAEWFQREYGRQLAATKLDPLSFLLLHQNGHLFINERREYLVPYCVDPDLIFHQRKISLCAASAKSPRRLVFISHNLRLQGAQTSLFELAAGCRKHRNYDVRILAPGDGPM